MAFLRVFASRRARVAFNVVSLAVGLVIAILLTRHFVEHGWPLAQAEVLGVVAAAALFVAAFVFKAWGWQRLFIADARPPAIALGAAGGAASVTGLALPGRFDEVVRVAVVRRYRGRHGGIGGVLLSLFALGLIDNAALVPFAAVAAGIAAPTGLVRAGLLLVAFAGVLAALVVLALPRLSAIRRVVRYRLGRWLGAHAAPPRQTVTAWALVLVSWTLRAVALVILLDALALGFSIPLALVFLCASAAAAAVPIAPQGAVAQAGAGAAVLMAAGVGASQAVAFAIAAQALIVFAGAIMVALALVAHASSRVSLAWRPALLQP